MSTYPYCWWGEHLSQCLLSAQSHQPQLQLQGCRQCRCTPAYICKYQICFKTTFFLPVLPYSGWQDLDSLRQCLRQELHWFLLSHSHSGSVQDLAKLNCLLFNLRWLMIQVFIQYIKVFIQQWHFSAVSQLCVYISSPRLNRRLKSHKIEDSSHHTSAI